MSRRAAPCIGFFLLLPAILEAQVTRLEDRFKQLDRNNDDRLSRAELRQTPNIIRADSNKDGFVTVPEARAYFGRRMQNHRAGASDLQEAKGLFEVHRDIAMPAGPMAVGVLDANADGWLDLVFPNSRQSGTFTLALNRGAQNDGRGLELRSLQMSDNPGDNRQQRRPKGLGLHDFNNDGLLDVYLGNRDGGGPSLAPDGSVRQPRFLASSINSVQISNGDGTFATRDLGINSRGSEVRSVVFADFDQDGYDDSFHVVSPYYGPGWGGSPIGNELHPGTERWNLFRSDMIRETLPRKSFWQDEHGRAVKMFKGTVIRDFDGDGKPDIATGAYADIWGGSMRRNQTRDDARLDLDKDGIPDTTWPGDWERGLFLLRNVSEPGKIRFADVSNRAVEEAYSSGTSYPQMHVYSILAADIDHDADLDLIVTGPRNSSAHRSLEDTTPVVRVLRNDSTPGQMKFADITENSGFAFLNAKQVEGYPLTRRAPNLAAGVPLDYDNDSHVDLIFVDRQDGLPAGDARLNPWVIRNAGEGRFERVSSQADGLSGHFNDLSYGDFDHDGQLDLVFVNGDPRGSGRAVIFRNAVENSNHWIALTVGWPENRLGIGSKVIVSKAGMEDVLGYDEVRTDFCYRSKRSTTLHFGLGQVKAVDVTVITPGEKQQRFERLAVDKTHELMIDNR